MTEFVATLVPLLGRALLDFVWQGVMIGLVAALLLQSLRHARPQVRYLVACLALLACLVIPLAGILMQLQTADDVVVAGASAPMVLRLSAAPDMGMPLPSPSDFEQALPWIVALWASGAGALSLRMAMGVAWIHRMRSAPLPADSAAWQARLDALAARFAMKCVALRIVDAVDSPVAAGWWRPVVLLPAAIAARMPVELVEALLAHELAHIRRHDYLVNLFQGVVEALLFYHPVTWWLSHRIRVERELIADRLAAEATGEPRRLAIALSELSELSSPGCAHYHLAPAAHGGHLMSRIEQLVRPNRRSTGGRIAFPLLGLAAACVAFYAHAQIGADAPAPVSAAAPISTSSPISTPTPVSTSSQSSTPSPISTPAPIASPTPATISSPVAAPTVVAQTQRIHVNDTPSKAYGLVRKGGDGGVTMSGSTDDLRAIESARKSLQGDFLWFRRDGKAYVVTDASTVASAREAWRESDRIGQQMEVLGDQMEVHGKKMEALGAQMEKLSVNHQPSPAMQAASRRMQQLGAEQSKLAAQQSALAARMTTGSEAEQEALERQMDALGDQMDALGDQMDQQGEIMDAESDRLDAATKPMDELGRQMDEASKPMDALGEQMDALGEQQERLALEAERKMDVLISDALAKGLAKPAPGSVQRQ